MNRLGKLAIKIIAVLSVAAVTFALSMYFVSAPGTYSHFISQARSDNNTFTMGEWSQTTAAGLLFEVPATTIPGISFELSDTTTGTSIENDTSTTDTSIATEE